MEAAQVFGVTEGAIPRAVKTLNIGVVKNMTLESAHKLVEKNLNTWTSSRRSTPMPMNFLTSSCDETRRMRLLFRFSNPGTEGEDWQE